MVNLPKIALFYSKSKICKPIICEFFKITGLKRLNSLLGGEVGMHSEQTCQAAGVQY